MEDDGSSAISEGNSDGNWFAVLVRVYQLVCRSCFVCFAAEKKELGKC